MNVLAALGRVVVAVLERVLVRPVREGRLRWRGPAGYGAMVALALTGIALALALALLAPVLRDRLPLVPTLVGIDAPSAPIGLVLGTFVLAVALVHTSALHARAWWRATAIALAIVYLSAIAPVAVGTETSLVLGTAAGALTALVLLQVLRWRRRSAWWELVLVLAVYATATAVIMWPSLRAGAALGLGGEVEAVWYLLRSIAPMAGPVVLVASVATTQVGLRAAAWTVRGARVLAPGWVALVLGVLVIGFRVVVDVLGWLDTLEGSATRIAAGAGFGLVCAGAWGATAWAGRRFRRSPLGHMTSDLTPVAIPLAVVVLLGSVTALVLTPVAAMLDTLADYWRQPALSTLGTGLQDAAIAVDDATRSTGLAIVVVAAILIAAVLLAASGWRGPSAFVAVLAIVYGTETIWGLEVPLYYLPLVLTGLTLTALIVMLIRGRLTTRRLEAVTLLGLLTTLLSIRDVVGESVALVVGGGVAVVISLVWAFLTGGGMTEPVAGRRGRAAWFLGYTLLGFSVLAFVTLSGSPAATYDAEQTADTGVVLFGTAIVITAVVACAVALVRDRDLGELG